MSTTRRRFLRISRDIALGLGAGGLVAMPAGCEQEGEAPAPPPPPPTAQWKNVVLVVVDDLGVTDCGGCGSDYYHTPAMNRMASEGLRFTQAYSPSPLCSSSRAAILTGKYPHRLGITGAIVCKGDPVCDEQDRPYLKGGAPVWQKVVTPSYMGHLAPGERTIAEYLRDAGFVTAHIGKWHLGNTGYGPETQGYMHVVGGGEMAAPTRYFAPYSLAGISEGPPGEYLTDRLTAESLAFIHANRDVPFFLSLAHFGVHLPLQAPADLVAAYWRLRDTGNAQRNATYAAMLDRVDQSIGALLDTLDALGLGERTLVIVTSDNGGFMHLAVEQYLHRVTSNGPFRKGKASLYEGGIRVPMLMRGGARITPGTVSDVPVDGIDILPTILAFTGLSPVTAIDGQNLLPHIETGVAPAARPLYWHYPHYTPMRTISTMPIDEHAHLSLPTSTVRMDDYKLMRIYGEGEGFGYVDELYNLAADPGEIHDIANREPAIVATLGEWLTAHLAESGALVPIPNRAYRELLDGWRVDRDCTTVMAHGFLRVTASGPYPQLGSGKVLLEESFVCRLRMRSTRALALVLRYSTSSGARAFDANDRVAVSVLPGAEFVDVDLRVTVLTGTPVTWLRVEPGTSGDVVEIDNIRVLADADTARILQQWQFNGVSDLRYGGSWFSATDTFVACGPGSLQIDMPGEQPAIMSPLVTLFGPLRMQLRLRSTGAGPCALAWSLASAFEPAPTRRVEFSAAHDGAWHEHELLIDERSDAPVQRLLLSLGSAMGVAEIDYIRVFDSQDSLVMDWDFCAGQVA